LLRFRLYQLHPCPDPDTPLARGLRALYLGRQILGARWSEQPQPTLTGRARQLLAISASKPPPKMFDIADNERQKFPALEVNPEIFHAGVIDTTRRHAHRRLIGRLAEVAPVDPFRLVARNSGSLASPHCPTGKQLDLRATRPPDARPRQHSNFVNATRAKSGSNSRWAGMGNKPIVIEFRPVALRLE
jgi:hypothetical protein